MSKEIKTLPRRKFFGNIGLGLAGLIIWPSFLTFKLPLMDKKEASSRKKVRIIEHPMAVKRSKKGLRG